jgi:catalase
MTIQEALQQNGAQAMLIAKLQGKVKSRNGESVEAGSAHIVTTSVVFDAVYVPGGEHVEALKEQGDALVNEAFRHAKPIAARGRGAELFGSTAIGGFAMAGPDANGEVFTDQGVVTQNGGDREEFVEAFSMPSPDTGTGPGR